MRLGRIVNKFLCLAISLSVSIIVIFHYFYIGIQRPELFLFDELGSQFLQRRNRVRNICDSITEQGAVLKNINWKWQFKRKGLTDQVDIDGDQVDQTMEPDEAKGWDSVLHVIPKFNIVYCHAPKAASRNLLRYFVKLSNETIDDDSVAQLKVHTRDRKTLSGITSLSTYPVNAAVEIMANYKKVVFSRNPLARLLSAWRDKLAPEKRNSLFAKHYGSKIIGNYRPNATEDEIRRGHPVFLKEFFQFLDDSSPTLAMNSHWRPIHEICFICAVKYDYIGQLEHIDDEVDYIARRATNLTSLPKIMTEPPPVQTKTESQGDKDPKIESRLSEIESRLSEVQRLPRELVERVLMKYKLDYDFFGYDMKADLKDAFSRALSK